MSDFIQFASSHGLIINNLQYGKIVRCPTESHRSSRNGAFFFDGEWGWCQNWESDDQINVWKSDKVVDSQELREKVRLSQQKHHQERARLNQDAANKAQWILSQCELDLSAYLGRKGFPEMCANVWKREGEHHILVVPMRVEKKIAGCQLIDHEGNKKFLKGQVTKDACFTIGNGKLNFFVEGYVSGLSLQKILESLKISYRIFVTFSAGNLLRLAKRIDGFVIADNDASKAGEKAAIESGRRYWMPPVAGWDINDQHMHSGVFKAALEIKKLIYSKP